jgi:hypothetical protein
MQPHGQPDERPLDLVQQRRRWRLRRGFVVALLLGGVTAGTARTASAQPIDQPPEDKCLASGGASDKVCSLPPIPGYCLDWHKRLVIETVTTLQQQEWGADELYFQVATGSGWQRFDDHVMSVKQGQTLHPNIVLDYASPVLDYNSSGCESQDGTNLALWEQDLGPDSIIDADDFIDFGSLSRDGRSTVTYTGDGGSYSVTFFLTTYAA